MSSIVNSKPGRKPLTPYVSSVAAPAISSSSDKVSLIRHESSSSTSAVLNAVRQSLSADRPSSAGMMSLQRELEFSKAELEREQAQRKLDRQKSDQVSGILCISSFAFHPYVHSFVECTMNLLLTLNMCYSDKGSGSITSSNGIFARGVGRA